ncbi:MAG: DNA replication/repair protein RecF [Chloroflexi bacterium]|jgi:DNA replication and repair protein RecF|nr:DNA replication/repair protein RecF [Chloroflexota bacterium]MBT3669290.1 DNA replication/repair protein RecF [Chloroflexota bacterium]MBT4003115.1 DNA replication/repair protein RecF [Chloroflexota bacterium]MBT4305997.1 DNA replication/repair protein RecF [Chloroflexota bacterium]MBT4532641.1 DNA replication/repair protein RecF [Chloroflexota bacterium]
MQLKHLSLTNFRNFARLDAAIPDETTLILGRNAQGKTSILEAIYYLATLSSFHAERDRELINFIEGRKPLAVGRIVAEYKKGGQDHQIEIRLIKEKTRNGIDRGRKEVLIDGVKKRNREAIGNFNAVLFLPQMMQIIEGSPGERRRFLDLLISQTSLSYTENLSEYNKVISQRNALLRQLNEKGGDSAQLAFWDERLSKRGAEIILKRIQVIQELEQIAARIHHELTRSNEVLRFAYDPAYDPVSTPENQMSLMDAPTDRSMFALAQIETGFRERLESNRQEEIFRGQTSTGPHRDDMRFLANGISLGTFGSRGQVRTVMMTMKLAEVVWMKEKTGEYPVLLLDEVLAELDEIRRSDLLKYVTNGQQALLTTTDLNLFDPKFTEGKKVWRIEDGVLGDNTET